TAALAPDGRSVRLCIRDDGRGFPSGTLEQGHGRGLRNMNQRARAVGGTLEVEGRAGRCSVTLVLPVTSSEAATDLADVSPAETFPPAVAPIRRRS
ncbi:hypothetical protein K2X89_11040, partial [Myxococcota bacterium]|nr:hypothetical protein [Myxococcota bacterium]